MPMKLNSSPFFEYIFAPKGKFKENESFRNISLHTYIPTPGQPKVVVYVFLTQDRIKRIINFSAEFEVNGQLIKLAPIPTTSLKADYITAGLVSALHNYAVSVVSKYYPVIGQNLLDSLNGQSRDNFKKLVDRANKITGQSKPIAEFLVVPDDALPVNSGILQVVDTYPGRNDQDFKNPDFRLGASFSLSERDLIHVSYTCSLDGVDKEVPRFSPIPKAAKATLADTVFSDLAQLSAEVLTPELDPAAKPTAAEIEDRETLVAEKRAAYMADFHANCSEKFNTIADTLDKSPNVKTKIIQTSKHAPGAGAPSNPPKNPPIINYKTFKRTVKTSLSIPGGGGAIGVMQRPSKRLYPLLSYGLLSLGAIGGISWLLFPKHNNQVHKAAEKITAVTTISKWDNSQAANNFSAPELDAPTLSLQKRQNPSIIVIPKLFNSTTAQKSAADVTPVNDEQAVNLAEAAKIKAAKDRAFEARKIALQNLDDRLSKKVVKPRAERVNEQNANGR